MRRSHTLIFNEVLEGTGALYHSPEFDAELVNAGSLALYVVVDRVSGSSPTLTVQIEESATRIQWNNRSSVAEINAVALSTSANTIIKRIDTGAQPFVGFARLRIVLGGTTPRAHVRIWATTRSGRMFLPPDFAGCKLWFRSDLGITLNGTTVSAWANQADAAFRSGVVQPTAANQPTYVAGAINGLPALDFDGGDYLDGDPYATYIDQPATYILTIRSSAGTTESCFDTCDAVYRHEFDVLNGPDRLEQFSGTSHIETASHANENMIVSLIYDGASSMIRKNGTLLGTGDAGDKRSGSLRLGASYHPLFFWTGYHVEFVAFTRALATHELLAIERYMGNRYAIAVT